MYTNSGTVLMGRFLRHVCNFLIVILIVSFNCIVALGEDVRTIIQQGHLILDYDVSADGKYVVSVDGTSIALWDLEKRRIIKLISYTNDKRVRFHPIKPDVVYIASPTAGVPDDRKFFGLNLFTGEHSGFVLGKDLPKRRSYHDDYILKLQNGKINIKSRKSRQEIGSLNGFRNIFSYGGMAIGDSDSLVFIAGQYPVIWDIRNCKVAATIDYRKHLKANPDLTFPTHSGVPVFKDYTPDRGVDNFHYGYQDHFHCMANGKGLFWMGSFDNHITLWNSHGVLIYTHFAEKAPVYGISRLGKNFVATTFRGVSMGNIEDKSLKRIPEYNETDDFQPTYAVTPPFRGNRFATVRHTRSGFGELRMGTFGKPGAGNKLMSVGSPLNGVSVSPDENRLLAHGQMAVLREVTIDDAAKPVQYNTDSLSLGVIWSSAYLDNSRFATASQGGEVTFWTSGCLTPRKVVRKHFDQALNARLTHNGKLLITSDKQGAITLWDAAAEKEVVSAYAFNQGKDYIFITPDNYYKGTKGSFEGVHFSRGMEVFPLEQFDLRYNRPDIVLERLGVPKEETEPYRQAWLKRLRRMNYTEDMLSGELHAPEVAINNERYLEGITAERLIPVDVTVTDSKYTLNKFFVNLNGVPLLGKNGRDISARKSRNYSTKIDVELCEGNNTIEIFAINSKGVESYRKTVDVVCEPPEKSQRKLYVAAVGVSQYADPQFNLEYAAKDARDISSLFHGNVETLLLTDKEFTPASLKRISEFFSKAKRDDAVVLFYAGHGLLDNDLNYYLSHSSIDFNNPNSNGIAYDDFENILENVKAINRLCLVDACHSGEIDKEDYLAENVTKIEGKVKFRSAGAGARKLKGHGVALTQALFNELFVDIRWGIGATVVSSAGGMEAAMEGQEWNNGLFTWCLKKGLTDRSADLNGDSRVSVSELGEYLCTQVNILSDGKQVPTMRAQNNRNDFYIN